MNTLVRVVSKSSGRRSRGGRNQPARSGLARMVVLDSVGFVKHRNGRGVLRLKLVGPSERLARLRLQEGERLAIDRHALLGERAA